MTAPTVPHTHHSVGDTTYAATALAQQQRRPWPISIRLRNWNLRALTAAAVFDS